MSTQTLVRRKSTGQTGNGGLFAEHSRTDADVVLAPARLLDFVTKVNDRFPLPQANQLRKVLSVVDAVDAGANSADSVAEALGVTNREGAYYGDAAGYLGFVDLNAASDQKTYELTPLGEMLLHADAYERVAIAREVVANVPSVQLFAESDGVAVIEHYAESGLADSTAERRAATVASWYHDIAIENDSEFTGDVSTEVRACGSRAVSAAQHAADERARRAAELQMKPRDEAPNVCPECSMVLPVSGICGNC